MLFFNFLVGFVLALAALVNAVPISEDGLQAFNITVPGLNASLSDMASTLGYDPSFDHHDYSMVQAWMGKAKVQVGDLTGNNLFWAVRNALLESCPSFPNGNGHCSTDWPEPKGEIRSHCTKQDGSTIPCVTMIWRISAEWQTEDIRHTLINAVAGFLGAVTVQDPRTSHNCWWQPDGTKACNVGDVVRVSLPTWGKNWYNFMNVRLLNAWTGYGRYDCCDGDGLKQMDAVLAGMEPTVRNEFKSQQLDWYADSRCIINGWQTC